MTTQNQLAKPDQLAQQYSDELLILIKQRIAEAGGKISFADYMQLCLYEPGLGYYSAGSHKIGEGGDFTTAPEISPLFSRSLAQHIHDVLRQLTQADLLEFGAGTGKMAVDILQELETLHCLPQHYFICEASADLQQRQQQTIQQAIPHLVDRVIWLDQIPEKFSGVIVANEVCDAMPVHRLSFSKNSVSEQYIELSDNDDLQWCEGDLSQLDLVERAAQIQQQIGQQSYLTEVNLHAEAWVKSLANSLQQGAIFIIDYGYDFNSYYHPERSQGSLMCYFQQQGHDNPLILPGIQDITAHVDFSALAHSAFNNDLDVAAYQTQADFLIAGGITELMSHQTNELVMLQQAAEVKRLTLPTEMGESFKVLTLTRQLDQLLVRAQLRDQRHKL
ncbi:hypothetical protein A9Q78_05185 [Methylophaga sp. 41_12_T18]|nr:hypothetical protein A9Q78_05185 [Methylophaga sp. 41_12_T18]